MLAARLLLITVINLARQQIEIKRRRLGATSTWPAERQDPKATPGHGTAQPQNAIREDRDFVWVTRQAVTAKRTTKRKRRREKKKQSCVTTLLLSCS